ncbi:unnamed protein product [Cylicostephanus goldi]|uniref:Uncharacterized protein n=1 Tax=Cylicostephanus goldi TaxID=71465 RepID=A0A3P6QF82_CYLGO|nr:unnamed protein product [Cylicostephanus goldi]
MGVTMTLLRPGPGIPKGLTSTGKGWWEKHLACSRAAQTFVGESQRDPEDPQWTVAALKAAYARLRKTSTVVIVGSKEDSNRPGKLGARIFRRIENDRQAKGNLSRDAFKVVRGESGQRRKADPRIFKDGGSWRGQG